MKIIVVLAVLLLIVNVMGTVWLVQHTNTSSGPRLSDSTMAQVDKLFAVMTNFQTELENVTAQAKYPDDKDKESAKKTLMAHSFNYQLARLAYLGVKEKRSREALLDFFRKSCGENWWATCQLMSPPTFQHYDFGKIVNGQYQEGTGTTTYGNVSRLESQEEEFNVLALSLLNEIK